MSNLPEVKIGVVAVSRDCFPESLSVNRRKALMKAYTEKYGTDSVYECPVCIVESEIHMVQALEDIKKELETGKKFVIRLYSTGNIENSFKMNDLILVTIHL